MPKIYLDYNATAPARAEVVELVAEIMASPHNPSSVHSYGRRAKQYLEAARKQIAEYISCFANEIIFTASGTEANNMAITSFAHSHEILTSSIEHASVLAFVKDKPSRQIPVDEDGVVKLDSLEKMLSATSKPAFVSVMLANNETGVIQPIKEIAEIVHRFGGIIHTDAVQALGKIPLDMGLLGVDMMSLSAHKIGGVQGAGALIVRQNIDIKPLIIGGGQEGRKRAGTENIAAIVGFAKAVEIASHDNWQLATEKHLRAMEQKIKLANDKAIIVGENSTRLPNTSMIITPNVSSEVQLMKFDLAGFAVSSGSACASGRVEPSHVLQAMGYDAAQAISAVRISAGHASTEQDIIGFTTEWIKLSNRLS